MTTSPEPALSRRRSPHLVAYVAALAVAAALAGLLVAGYADDPPGHTVWATLPALALLVGMAEVLVVKVRYGDEIDGINLVDAALAPMLFAFPGGVVVATVAVVQLATSLGRRLPAVKTAFNVAQWSLAAAAGAAVVERVAHGGSGVDDTTIAAVGAALVAVWVVNNTAFTLVVAAAEGQRPVRMVRDLLPVILPGWVGGWFVNALLGLLYVLAYAGHPAAVVLFPVPLVLLHLAYRGYAHARADRMRLAVLHRAAQVLAERLDAREAIPEFLREVARGFEARAVLLVLPDETHECRDGTYEVTPGPADVEALTGGRDHLSAALGPDSALVVLDQAGVQGGTEQTVLETLARETAGALARSRLVSDVVEEQRRFEEIVTTTSDGICTLDADGVVQSWNPAMTVITGLTRDEVVGKPGGLGPLRARNSAGSPVDLALWPGRYLPSELLVSRPHNETRRLSCSYSRRGADEGELLVIVARDITPADEIEQLRQEFGRLAKVEAAQRIVVEQLQSAVMPERPEVGGVELGVSYLASEETAPTGGDLYDWQQLPDGDVHIAVVDVLGHGVAATKDALAVVHTLRTIAVDGTPLPDIIERADQLLGAQHPELVATVVVARYTPSTGYVRVASGGHPPALVVSARGEVTQLGAHGGAIGWPGAGSDLVAETYLDVRDALVLYTDGLVEAGKDILAGMDALVGHAQDVAHLPATDLADELVRRSLEGAARRDDTLALVLRRLPMPVAERSHTWHVEPGLAEVSATRRSAGHWLDGIGARSDDALLVVSELLANAVRFARTSATLTLSIDDGILVIEVSDDGPGVPDLDERGTTLPATEDDSGRGLFLVRAVAADVSVLSTSEGSVVRAVVPVGVRTVVT